MPYPLLLTPNKKVKINPNRREYFVVGCKYTITVPNNCCHPDALTNKQRFYHHIGTVGT